MSLPSEYVIEDAVRSIDDVIVYRANHPIHGAVNVYLPDNTLPPQLARAVRKRLYQNGLQMRNVSLLSVGLATKALEVSQNPNEPYIVTKYAKHDLEEFISNGVIIKPKRMFAILSQILEAIANLAANGWIAGHIHPRQIKLSQQHTGDITFTVIEGVEQQSDVTKVTNMEAYAGLGDVVTKAIPQEDIEKGGTAGQEAGITKGSEQTQPPKGEAAVRTTKPGVEHTITLGEDEQIKDAQKLLRTKQRNIYLLGNIAYQLLFGRKYQASDKLAAANIKKLGRRWRGILQKALNENIGSRYDTYETMRQDVRKALNRNKRIAIASIPFLVLLVIIGGYFAYGRYHRYRIMTSEAGQAIKTFLDIVNKTDDEVPELKKPQPPPSVPDEQGILRPFDKIEAPK